MSTSGFTFTREGGDIGLVLKSLSGRIEGETAGLVLRAAQHAEGEIRATIYETFPDGRTGALARSFRATFIGRDADGVTSASVSSDLVYARIQDEGGTIRPNSAQRLAIPLKRLPVGKWPRHYAKGELTLIQSKRGNSILAKITKTKGGKDKIDPHFVLVRSSTLRGRGYVALAASRARPGVEEIMAEGLQRIADAAASDGSAAGGAGG